MLSFSYLETLLNSSERFVTLDKLFPLLDSGNNPIFITTSRTIVFDVTYNGRLYKLTVPIKYSASEKALIKQECFFVAIRDIKEFLPINYYENEMLVFNNDGKPIKQDVIMQDCTNTSDMHTYIRKNLFIADKRPMRDALMAIANLSEKLLDQNIIHGGIAPRMIRFHNTKPVTAILSDAPLILNKNRIKDFKTLAISAIIFYLISCRPNLYSFISNHKISEYYKYILSAAQFHGNKSLENILLYIQDNDYKSIVSSILILADTPFNTEFTLLEKLLGDCYKETTPELKFETISKKKESGDLTLKVDWSTCNFIGPVCHNLIRFKYGDEWGYATRNGDRLPIHGLLEAEDFYEGRAVVKTQNGFGLIDSNGKFVIMDDFEDMIWMGPENIVAAQQVGLWYLYDRCGRCITKTGYDYMGECCEGMISVCKNNHYGYINKKGQKVIPMIYDEAFDFHSGKATVIYKGREITIDKYGTRVK